ncbi:MAG: tetratricopeptide repeat protein [Spirochaetaceae bacterium]|jgi:tetratricopeptide (TPR) repeat protein|nr:tetratricopeptide repeat protein [Spirochaetaceae bacterium]
MMKTNASGLVEGKRLFGLKRWDLALREFLTVKTDAINSEEYTELAYYAGLCYTKLGRYDEGRLYLEQAITKGANSLRVYQCHMTLAYIYSITNRSRLAEFELGELIKNGFVSVQIYTTLAYVVWMQKNPVLAVRLYEKALKIDENNTTAMNGLGYILADTGQDVLRGLRFCRKAVDRRPRNAAYLDSLGWAYYKSGNSHEAGVWLRRALNLAPGQKEIRNHLRIIEEIKP